MADLAKLDDDTLDAFFGVKWSSPICEVCKTSTWGLARDNDARWAGVPVVTKAQRLSTNFWAVLPVICANCGNTKLLTAGTVELWAATPDGAAAVAKYKDSKNG